MRLDLDCDREFSVDQNNHIFDISNVRKDLTQKYPIDSEQKNL